MHTSYYRTKCVSNVGSALHHRVVFSTKTPPSTSHAGLQIWALIHARTLHRASKDLKFVITLYRSIHVNILDHRDRVFAFLGLLREEGIEIMLDYTASVEEVYVDTANALIQGPVNLQYSRPSDLEKALLTMGTAQRLLGCVTGQTGRHSPISFTQIRRKFGSRLLESRT